MKTVKMGKYKDRYFRINQDGTYSIGCNFCDQILDSSNFYVKYKNIPATSLAHWNSTCKLCTKNYKNAHYAANKDRIYAKARAYYYDNRESELEKIKVRALKKSKDPAALIERRRVAALNKDDRFLHEKHRQWKQQASLRGLNWNLNIDDIYDMLEAQNYKCYYTGVPLRLETCSDFTLSVDRIDSNRAYDLDNVVLCATVVNLMKLDQTIDEFKEIIKLLFNNKDKW